MKVQLTGTVQHDGIEYKPGQYLTCSDDDARSLIRYKVAVEVTEEPKCPPPQPPSEQRQPVREAEREQPKQKVIPSKSKPKKRSITNG